MNNTSSAVNDDKEKPNLNLTRKKGSESHAKAEQQLYQFECRQCPLKFTKWEKMRSHLLGKAHMGVRHGDFVCGEWECTLYEKCSMTGAKLIRNNKDKDDHDQGLTTILNFIDSNSNLKEHVPFGAAQLEVISVAQADGMAAPSIVSASDTTTSSNLIVCGG